jgi:hypothetical protein
MRRIANTESIIAEGTIAILVYRNINVAIVEIVVRQIPVSLVKSEDGVS